MRLFVAVNFSPQAKSELSALTARCREALASGVAVRPDNFHLTLAFLGETQPCLLSTLRKAVASVGVFEPFILSVESLGRFVRNDGDILWADVRGDISALTTLRSRLCKALSEAGFPVENEEFHPHMTLVRQAVYLENFKALQMSADFTPIPQRVENISLMKSERLGGILTYTEI